MCRLSLWVLLGVLVAGCEQPRVYEIDFNQTPGFQWDGKVRITKTAYQRMGPLFTIEDDCRVDQIEFVSRDGRSASIDPQGYRDVPVATINLASPSGTEILGTRGYWDGGRGNVLIMEPDSVQALLDGLSKTATQPSASPDPGKCPVHSVPTELRPYAQHIDQLSLADCWAVALQYADLVTVEFRVPEEHLLITLQGDPRQLGPSILEVRSEDGRLLRRFERKRVPVEELMSAKARAASRPETSPTR